MLGCVLLWKDKAQESLMPMRIEAILDPRAKPVVKPVNPVAQIEHVSADSDAVPLTVKQLKDACTARSLPVSGTKAILIGRLRQAGVNLADVISADQAPGPIRQSTRKRRLKHLSSGEDAPTAPTAPAPAILSLKTKARSRSLATSSQACDVVLAQENSGPQNSHSKKNTAGTLTIT